MSITHTYQNAWDNYQKAINALYTSEETVAVPERDAGSLTVSEQLEGRSEAVLTRSEELRQVLAASLEVESLAQRELAALKLVAAAAYDLSVASDLLQAERSGPTGERERSAGSVVLASKEVRRILDAPLEAGLLSLLERERAVLPSEPKAARAQLETTITTFLTDIPLQAASLSQMAVAGVIPLGVGPAQGAVSLAAQELLAHVPSGLSLVVRRAAALVAEALNKLWTAIGPQREAQAQQQITQWLNQLQRQRDTVTSLLGMLYETQRLGEETTRLIEGAPEGTVAARYNQATQTLENLLQGYEKTKGLLEWVLRILALIKTPLLGAAPWGPLAVYASYLGVLGYAIYSGGDYLDWYRTGNTAWLDRVQGLRVTVQRALSSDEHTK
jgi:hypothetical protein